MAQGTHNIKCDASTWCTSHTHTCKICNRFYEIGDMSYMNVGCKGEPKEVKREIKSKTKIT